MYSLFINKNKALYLILNVDYKTGIAAVLQSTSVS